MQNTTGVSGAAPIWAKFMTYAIPVMTGGEPTAFQRPGGIIDKVICAISGTEPSQWCPQQRQEIFASDQPPLPASEDLWKEATIDTWTGLLATPECSDFVVKKLTMNVTDGSVQRWLRKDDAGRGLAKDLGFDRPLYFTPDAKCDANSSRPTLSFENIKDNDVLTEENIDVRIIAKATDGFDIWRLELAKGNDPGDNDWQTLFESNAQVPEPNNVFTWTVKDFENGKYTLRLRMENANDGYAEKKVHIEINFTPPTPTATPITPTPTLEPPTSTPTDTLEPPTPIPPASETPTVAPTAGP